MEEDKTMKIGIEECVEVPEGVALFVLGGAIVGSFTNLGSGDLFPMTFGKDTLEGSCHKITGRMEE